ncbi:C4-dicarboxylate transport system, small permease component [Bacillus sp. OxB-1]|uniref:TRAP transporter small permease n=1 Tax=Bacillus sp. (strain OxB-1) TaxID=98228 RepID=UPI0005820C25|nr:TRAP transporter small permease [Bacillus sp. OxB-1]BAQ09130.1 C4-dicarboxylate transport system, small permease component [Bacillus sp. OxB-1]
MWDKTISTLNTITKYVTAALLILMTALIFVQIISRVLIGSSFSWTEELARYLMIWITFLGAGFAFQYSAHMGIDYFVNKISSTYSKLIMVIMAIASMFFFCFLFFQGIKLMEFGMMQKSSALKIPMGYVYLIFPISSALILLNLIDVTKKQLKVSNS